MQACPRETERGRERGNLHLNSNSNMKILNHFQSKLCMY